MYYTELNSFPRHAFDSALLTFFTDSYIHLCPILAYCLRGGHPNPGSIHGITQARHSRRNCSIGLAEDCFPEVVKAVMNVIGVALVANRTPNDIQTVHLMIERDRKRPPPATEPNKFSPGRGYGLPLRVRIWA